MILTFTILVEREEKSVTELFEPENVVYLSPDADEVTL